jgi:hypothetical protein
MELQEMRETDDLGACFVYDKSMADQLLKEHSVMIVETLNLTALIPYLIQNDCIRDEDVDQFYNSEPRSRNNMKLRILICDRGHMAFNGFLRALSQFTSRVSGEGGHRDLLASLKSGAKRMNYARKTSDASHMSRGSLRSDPLSSLSTTHGAANYTKIESIAEETNLCVSPGGEEGEVVFRDLPLLPQHHREEERPTEHHSDHEETSAQPPTPRRNPTPNREPYLDVVEFKYFLRGAVLFTCISSPIFFIGGIILTILSISAFATGKNCEDIVAPHSLTVFNLLCGLLCLNVPCLLIMLTVYYCCERRTKWKEEFRILSTKCCIIWTTIGFVLSFFILTVTDLLYALVYVAPQVYNNFSAWNETLCAEEVFVTSFWVLNISGLVVVVLVAVLGIYLSTIYFRWVTNPDKPGTLKGLILNTFVHSERDGYSMNK